MGRLESRLRRLTARVRGSAGSLEQARLQCMSDEELVEHIAKMAVAQGCPADQVPTEFDAASLWIEEQVRAGLQALSEEEREDWTARRGHLKAPSGRPWW